MHTMERVIDQRLRGIYQCLRYDLYDKAIQNLRDTFYYLQQNNGVYMTNGLHFYMAHGLNSALQALYANDTQKAHVHIRDLHYKILEHMLDKVHGYETI